MRKKITVLIGLMLFVPFVYANQAANRLTGLLQKYRTYQADFVQTTYDTQGRKIQTSSGRFYIMRPGRFRWEVEKPNKQIIIANNNILWVYDVDLQQATRRKLNSGGSLNAAALLSGHIKDLAKQFGVQQVSSSIYKLTPKLKQSPFKMAEMRFKNSKLVLMQVVNNLGQGSAFRFSKVKVNSNLSTSLFIFKAPKGVDVLKQ